MSGEATVELGESGAQDPHGGASVVRPSDGAIGRLRPLGAADVRIDGGFWGERMATNRNRTIPHGFQQLKATGTLGNLRQAAGRQGTYRAMSDSSGAAFPFLDTDVYKWLEAVGWELGHGPDAELAAFADEAIEVVGAAQRDDGYINSYVQVVGGGIPYQDLAWGHEFYCIGHLIQAGIAWHRRLGDDRLLGIARRAADAIDREFGPAGRDGIDGHPEVEMALVELWRVTNERRYLDLASRLVDLRGHGLLGDGRFGPAYWQDHTPVRSAATVAGHAVRQLYLDCGAVDVAVETGDQELLDAVTRRWTDMIASRTYLTGGLGSRHRDESFGDPFELPPDRAYAETCASIASVMLGWRLLLATGQPRFADAIERTMFNGVLSGLSLDGASFFYVNPLQRRSHRSAARPGDGARAHWYPCACCPPNLMRLISSWEQYLATVDEDGIQIHQYASADIEAAVGGATVRLEIRTGYPWDGGTAIRIAATPDDAWALSMRIPRDAGQVTITDPDGQVRQPDSDAGTIDLRRRWRVGDTIELGMALPVLAVTPDPRVDATRGCLAFIRGPLVYCIETADIPPGAELEDVTVASDVVPTQVPRDDLGPSFVGLALPASAQPTATGETSSDVVVGAVPYFAWANRTVEAMRVWVPATSAAPVTDPTPGDAAVRPAPRTGTAARSTDG